jgi:UDPglucose 6-dehydrogenase
MDDKNIAMIGAGYVGLVSSACFAELGFKVVCIDKDQCKIKKLQNGHTTIYEPSLTELIQKNLLSGRLNFTRFLPEAILQSTILFIAVGTPIKENEKADISDVKNVISEIAPLLKSYKLIVIKSTVPVGTCRALITIIKQLNPRALFDMVSNPEFLRAGSGVKDFMTPDRIIVGTETTQAYSRIMQLYQTFNDQKIPIVQTTLESAELTKYAANSFLATKIAFVNEIACLCEKLNAEVNDVLQGIGLDKRIGKDYLQPGPGFGGSCLYKDALALTNISKIAGAPTRIVESALNSNINHKKRIIKKIIAACNGSVTNKKLAILGMAFKANTDDIRESPALYIISELLSQGAILKLYDPIIKQIPTNLNVYWGIDIYDTVNKMDAIIIMTEWDEFRKLDLKKIKAFLRNTIIEPILIDLRNLYSPQTVIESGLRYCSIGRLTHKPLSSHCCSNNVDALSFVS